MWVSCFYGDGGAAAASLSSSSSAAAEGALHMDGQCCPAMSGPVCMAICSSCIWSSRATSCGSEFGCGHGWDGDQHSHIVGRHSDKPLQHRLLSRGWKGSHGGSLCMHRPLWERFLSWLSRTASCEQRFWCKLQCPWHQEPHIPVTCTVEPIHLQMYHPSIACLLILLTQWCLLILLTQWLSLT